MKIDSDPGSQGPVNLGQISLQPDPLLAALCIVHIIAEEDVVRRADIHRVEEVGGRPTRPVGCLQGASQRAFEGSLDSRPDLLRQIAAFPHGMPARSAAARTDWQECLLRCLPSLLCFYLVDVS